MEKLKLKKNRGFSFKNNHSKLVQNYQKSNKANYKKSYKRLSNSCISSNTKLHTFCHKFILAVLSKDKTKDDFITIPEGENEEIKYIKGKELGSGGFGVCYIFISTKDFNQYATKVISKKGVTKEDKNTQSIISEINTLKSLNYPKIVKFKSYYEDPENVYIIQELCKNRSLADLLKNRGKLTEFEVQSYMFQLIQGLKYLHDRKIIHRDLKPNNIFLDEKFELKIGDFGLIAKLDNNKDRKKTTCGTPHYMAPEVINPGKKGYSFEVDIWSMGVIMYNLLTGKLPFGYGIVDKQKIYKQILEDELNEEYLTNISDVAKDLIKQLLVKECRKRPGLNQIVYHDFFHMNIFPKYPDIKFLKKEPSLKEIREYMPDMDDKGKIYKEAKIKELYKLVVSDIPNIRYEDIKKYQLNHFNNNNQINYWVSYIHISHSGFCYYQMNNGLIGIIYKNEEKNDYSGLKLIFNSETDKIYEIIDDKYKYNDIINTYDADICPEHIQKQFKQFIDYHILIGQKKYEHENKKNLNIIYQNTTNDNNNNNNSNNNSSSINITSENNSIKSEETIYNNISINNSINNSNKNEKQLIYIKSLIVDKYAKLLILSDETKQYIFKDKVEILLSEQKEILTYIDINKKKAILPLINIMKNSNKEFISRIKYIKKTNFSNMKEKLKEKWSNEDFKNKNITTNGNENETIINENGKDFNDYTI